MVTHKTSLKNQNTQISLFIRTCGIDHLQSKIKRTPYDVNNMNVIITINCAESV